MVQQAFLCSCILVYILHTHLCKSGLQEMADSGQMRESLYNMNHERERKTNSQIQCGSWKQNDCFGMQIYVILKKGKQIIIDLIMIIIFVLLRSDGDACRLSLLKCLESMVGLEGFALWWMTGFVPLSQNTKCPGPLVARPFIPTPFFWCKSHRRGKKRMAF